MTYDPEAAERLVAILTPLITEQSCGEWDDKTINEDVQMFLPPLLTALQEARNAALREAADLCVEYSTHHGTGMFDKHSHACSEAILALIDTPAPQPDADEREAMVYLILDAMLGRYPGRDMARAVADALLAAGWTRKREADALIEAERRGAERMRERATQAAEPKRKPTN